MPWPSVLALWGIPAVFAMPAVPDSALADMRGGFRLPSGVDIAMTVQTQTAIDGQVALRTVFRVDEGAPVLVAYVPRAGETVAATRATTAAATSAATPNVTYDNRTGIRVTPGGATGLTVGAAGSTADLGAIPDGLVQAGADGKVRVDTQGGIQTARIASDDIAIVHIAGQAFGSAIANTGSDRTIDTQTSVAISLSNAGPDVIGSNLFRVQGVALDALAGRLR